MDACFLRGACCLPHTRLIELRTCFNHFLWVRARFFYTHVFRRRQQQQQQHSGLDRLGWMSMMMILPRLKRKKERRGDRTQKLKLHSTPLSALCLYPRRPTSPPASDSCRKLALGEGGDGWTGEGRQRRCSFPWLLAPIFRPFLCPILGAACALRVHTQPFPYLGNARQRSFSPHLSLWQARPVQRKTRL